MSLLDETFNLIRYFSINLKYIFLGKIHWLHPVLRANIYVLHVTLCLLGSYYFDSVTSKGNKLLLKSNFPFSVKLCVNNIYYFQYICH